MKHSGQPTPRSASPPTDRAVDVLEQLAQGTPDGLSLTALSRKLDMAPATAHAVLAALCARGWVRRDARSRSYTVGSGLLAAAAAGLRTRPDVQVGRAVLHELVTELHCAVSLAERVDDELIVLELETGDTEPPAAVGDRFAFAAPFGPAFAAWASARDVDSWISGSGAAGRAATALRGMLQETRDRGYSIERFSPAHLRVAQLTAEVDESSLPPAVRQQMRRLQAQLTQSGLIDSAAESTRAPVTTIAAPVPNGGAPVQLSVALHPMRTLTDAQVARTGRALLQRVHAAFRADPAGSEQP